MANREVEVGKGRQLVLCYPGTREVRYVLRSTPYVDDDLIAGYLGKHVTLLGTEHKNSPGPFTGFEVESIRQQA